MSFWMDPTYYAPSALGLQTLIVSVGVLLLGALVLVREHWSIEGILFWLCTVTIGIWLVSFSCMYSSIEESTALFWAKAAYLGVPFIPTATYHFSTFVLRISGAHRRQIILYWLLSAFFAFTIMTSDLLVAGLYRYPWGWYPKYGWLSVPYLFFFFGVMLMTVRHYVIESRRKEKGLLAIGRARRLLAAFLILLAASVDYLPKFGLPIYPFGYVFVFIFLVITSHVIWQYRLVDLTAAFAADLILETMNEPLIVCDLEGKIRIVNAAFTKVFGYSREEVQGRAVEELTEDGGWQPSMMQQTPLKEHACLFHAKNGDDVHVSLSTSILKSSNDKPQGCVVIVRDVTESRRLERELKSFNETLEEHVDARTKELAVKVRELEWLNKVMMGREERILELKEQLLKRSENPS